MNILRVGKLRDIFGGRSQNWTGFRGHFYAFYGLFLRSIYRMGILFWVAKISNIFLGMPDIPNYFWGKQSKLSPSLRMKKK